MAVYPNPYVLNIIDLQNVVTNAGGESITAALQTQVTGLTAMIDTSNHIVYADAIRDYSRTGQLTVETDLNLGTNYVTGAQAALYSNGVAIGTASTEASGGTSIGSGNVTVGVGAGGMTMSVGAVTSTTVFSVGVDGTVTAAGAFYGTGFYTLSDAEKKEGVTRLGAGSLDRVCRLEPSRWRWVNEVDSGGTGAEAQGLIAQEVAEVFPELVVRGPTGSEHIDIMGLLGHIVGAIKELRSQRA